MAYEHIPQVSPFLINYLRKSRREWQNALPEKDWDQRQIDRAIGANEVIAHLEAIANGEVDGRDFNDTE